MEKMFSSLITSCTLSLMVIYVFLVGGVGAEGLNRNSAGLTALPSDISAAVTSIQVASNSIEEIEASLLAHLSALVTINAGRNSIHTFPNLCGIPAAGTLTYLSINYNDITVIPYDSLDCLTVIYSIDISYNDIASVPDTPGPSTTLEYFHLHYNQITTLSVWQHTFKKLKKLFISGNQLENVTADNFQNMPFVNDVEMSSTQQYLFPNLTHIATVVTALRLANNFISVIPYDLLDELTALTTLNLDNNQLTYFPDVTGAPIENLILNSNQFTQMPAFSTVKLTLDTLHMSKNYDMIALEAEDFEGFITLRQLFLEYNPIPFPDLTHVKQTLTYLYITSAAVTNFPVEMLEGFHALQKLNLNNNQLSEFPNEAVGSCTLTQLYLSSNQFTVLPDLSLIGQCLTTLQLHHNPFLFMPAESLSSMTSLSYLQLDSVAFPTFPDLRSVAVTLTHVYMRNSRSIHSIPEQYLYFSEDKTNSMTIWLDNQLLETIPAIHAPMATSVTINAYGNDLICDNTFRWAIIEPRFTVTGTCAGPSDVQGQSVNTLRMDQIVASAIELGDVEDPVSLHDGLLDTCTRIKLVRTKLITVCSQFPSQLVLRLLGGFDLVTDYTLRVTVTYTGGGCGADDLAMYTVTDDVMGSCDVSDVDKAAHNIQLCEMVTQQHDVYGTQQCVFECSKAMHMTPIIAFSVPQATVCDVAFDKITPG